MVYQRKIYANQYTKRSNKASKYLKLMKFPTINLTGRVYNHILVLRFMGRDGRRCSVWLVKCRVCSKEFLRGAPEITNRPKGGYNHACKGINK